MPPDAAPVRERLDEVQRGLDDVQEALARLDAGDLHPPESPGPPDPADPFPTAGSPG